MDDLIKYWILCFLKIALGVLDFVLDVAFGTTIAGGTRKERSRSSSGYESSAQLVKIVWRAKPNIFLSSYLKHFLYKHETYVHPNYVLDNKNATLVSVEKDCAVFSVSEPDVDVLDTKQFPFAFLSQFLNVTHLIILPISSFHRLAEEVGDPTKPVGLVHMTARSGSTLLAQLISRVPNTKVFSEAWALTNIAEMRQRGLITVPECRMMVQSALRLLCKVVEGEKVDTFFFKMTLQDDPLFPDIAEIFPQMKLFFNTRHPVPSLKSFEQAMKTVGQGLFYSLGFSWRDFLMTSRMFFPFDKKYDRVLETRYSKWRQNVTNGERDLAFFASALAGYFNGDQKKIYDHVILYEDISRDPDGVLTKIFNALSISLEHIPLAKSALKVDSQKGIFGKRMEARSYVLSEKLMVELDRMMVDIGAPIRHDMTDEEFRKVFGL